jgi:hypothetical protein
MKKSSRQILTVILLFTFLLGAGIGPALAQQQVKVNINKASVDELSTLKRIGPSILCPAHRRLQETKWSFRKAPGHYEGQRYWNQNVRGKQRLHYV